MSEVDSALLTVTGWLTVLLGLIFSFFLVIEQFLHGLLTALRVPADAQSLVILIVDIVFLLTAVRLFGGVIRVLLAIFLILLLLHMAIPSHWY